MPHEDPERWCNTPQLADRLKIRKNTIRAWARDGVRTKSGILKLRAVRVGSENRYHADDVSAFLSARSADAEMSHAGVD